MKPQRVGLLPFPADGQRRPLVFFLSHRGPDTKERLVRPVHFILHKLGVDHFFDQDPREGIRLMEDNGREMAEALYGAQVVVLFLSEGFSDSKWCVMEANAALRRELDENRHLVLPVYDSLFLSLMGCDGGWIPGRMDLGGGPTNGGAKNMTPSEVWFLFFSCELVLLSCCCLKKFAGVCVGSWQASNLAQCALSQEPLEDGIPLWWMIW